MKKQNSLFRRIINGSFLALLFIAHPSFGQTGVPVPEMNAIETEFINWLSTTTAKGGSLALSKNGKLVYARAFGKANIALTENTRPDQLFRVASISKPLTSIAIFKLIQEGKLNLTDKVYGPSGILNDAYYTSGITVRDPRIYNITVQHLLEHTAGFAGTDLFNREGNFTHSADLDVFMPELTARLGEPNPGTYNTITKFLLTQNLETAPGTLHRYNNVNFQILTSVVDKRAGMPMSEYLKTTILTPLSIYDVQAGKSLMIEKHEREAEYPTEPYRPENNRYTQSYYNDGTQVLWQYGGWSHEAAAGAGGYIGSPKDMVKLLNAIDGSPVRPDILNASTRAVMLTRSTVPDDNGNQPGYAKGWGANDQGDFYHNGGAIGTAAVWGHLHEGWAFAAFINGQDIGQDIESFIINLVRNNSGIAVPAHDLFQSPTINASSVAVSGITNNAATINWNNGNGNKRLVTIHAATAVNQFPIDGTNYAANTSLGSGSDLGNGNYVVYNGTGNSVTVTNLNPGTIYFVRVTEYNQNTVTGNHALYLLGENPVQYFGTSGAVAQIYQAEDQTWSQAVTETTNAGYTGTSYVNTNNVTGSWVEFSVNASTAGTYACSLRYANASTDRPANVILNGTTVFPAMSFPSTGSWTNWQLKTFNLSLVTGINKIRFVATTSSGNVNIDRLDVSGSGETPVVQYTLNTSSVNGTILSNPSGSTFAAGTTVILTAQPASGYMFSGWSGDVSSTSNPVSVMMNGNKNITAGFVPYVPQYVLATLPTNGAIQLTPSSVTYPAGTTVNALAAAPPNYQFSEWDGDLSGTANPQSITMNSNKTIISYFRFINTTEFCMEAESASDQASFAPYQVLNDANASGGKYIVVPNGTGNQSSPPTTSIATYNFNITQSGSYNVWLRILANNSNDNSIYIRTGTSSFTSWTPGTYTSWKWKKWSSRSFSAGSNSVSIARNEDGLQIDKIIVTKSSTTPSGTGCNATARLALNQPEPDDSIESTTTSLDFFPNPVSDNVSIAVELSYSSTAKLEAFNMLGEQKTILMPAVMQEGNYIIKYDVSQLASGMYLIRLTTDKETITRRLIVDR